MKRDKFGVWRLWDIGDYGLGHNIGKTAEGVGKLYDATQAKMTDPFTFIGENFTWDYNPTGIQSILPIGVTLNNLNSNEE